MNTAANRTSNLLAALAGAAALLVPPAAHAADPVHYVGVQVGRNDLKGAPATVDFGGGVRLSGNASLDAGTHLGVVVGRQTDNARFELELQQGTFKLRGVALGPLSEGAGGSGDYQTFTVNAYRTAPLSERVGAYVGAGIGFGAMSVPGASFASGCNCFAAADRSGLVYQVRLGLEYRIAAAHRAFVQYTWLSLPGAEGGGSPSVEYDRRGVGALAIGYRRTF